MQYFPHVPEYLRSFAALKAEKRLRKRRWMISGFRGRQRLRDAFSRAAAQVFPVMHHASTSMASRFAQTKAPMPWQKKGDFCSPLTEGSNSLLDASSLLRIELTLRLKDGRIQTAGLKKAGNSIDAKRFCFTHTH